MGNQNQVTAKGIVIGTVTTANGDMSVYSPCLDAAEQILDVLAGPASDVWMKLQASGRIASGERIARDAVRAVLTMDDNAAVTPAAIRGFLQKKLAEAGPDKPVLGRPEIEAMWRETLRASGGAVRKCVALILQIGEKEAGSIVPASQVAKIARLVADDFDVAAIRAWIDGLIAKAKAPEQAKPTPQEPAAAAQAQALQPSTAPAATASQAPDPVTTGV